MVLLARIPHIISIFKTKVFLSVLFPTQVQITLAFWHPTRQRNNLCSVNIYYCLEMSVTDLPVRGKRQESSAL